MEDTLSPAIADGDDRDNLAVGSSAEDDDQIFYDSFEEMAELSPNLPYLRSSSQQGHVSARHQCGSRFVEDGEEEFLERLDDDIYRRRRGSSAAAAMNAASRSSEPMSRHADDPAEPVVPTMLAASMSAESRYSDPTSRRADDPAAPTEPTVLVAPTDTEVRRWSSVGEGRNQTFVDNSTRRMAMGVTSDQRTRPSDLNEGARAPGRLPDPRCFEGSTRGYFGGVRPHSEADIGPSYNLHQATQGVCAFAMPSRVLHRQYQPEPGTSLEFDRGRTIVHDRSELPWSQVQRHSSYDERLHDEAQIGSATPRHATTSDETRVKSVYMQSSDLRRANGEGQNPPGRWETFLPGMVSDRSRKRPKCTNRSGGELSRQIGALAIGGRNENVRFGGNYCEKGNLSVMEKWRPSGCSDSRKWVPGDAVGADDRLSAGTGFTERGPADSGSSTTANRNPDRHSTTNTVPKRADIEGSAMYLPSTKAPTVKLDVFKGDTCLETFLAKFKNMADYYKWCEADKLFYLQAHLDGAAGQLLWSNEQQRSFEDVVKLLRTRFGTENQSERFRAELKARKRGKGESLQSLYQDVCRLLRLAYPDLTGTISDIIGRDAFLEALRDRELHIRILEKEPKTIDALRVATKLEAFDRVGDSDETEAAGRRKSQNVRSLMKERSVDETDDRLSTICQQMSELQTAVRYLQEAINVETNNKHSEDFAREQSLSSHGASGSEAGQSVNKVRPRNSMGRRKNDDRCRCCWKSGHWARDCPSKSDQTSAAKSVVAVVGRRRRPAEVYLKIKVAGKERCALLDTGCEHSCIAKKYFKSAQLRETSEKLFAANGHEITVQGALEMNFRVGSHETSANLLVSDQLDEMILGSDWLTENKCHWNFGEKTLKIGEEITTLFSRPSRLVVRRLYVGATTVVPSDTQAQIPVRMEMNSLRTPAGNWVAEPRVVHGCLLTARTLLSDDVGSRALPVINLGNGPQKLREGMLLCEAEFVPDGAVMGPNGEMAERTSVVVCGEPTSRRVDNPATSSEPTVSVATKNAVSRWSEPTSGQADDPVKADGEEPTSPPCSESDCLKLDNEYGHVKCVIDGLPSDLSEQEREVAVKFIREHANVFSRSEFDIGRTKLIPHRIDTGANRPVKQQLRRHPQVHLKFIDKQVQKMLDNDIIEESASP